MKSAIRHNQENKRSLLWPKYTFYLAKPYDSTRSVVDSGIGRCRRALVESTWLENFTTPRGKGGLACAGHLLKVFSMGPIAQKKNLLFGK